MSGASELQQALRLKMLDHRIDFGPESFEDVLPQRLCPREHDRNETSRPGGIDTMTGGGGAGVAEIERDGEVLARGGLMTQEGRGRSVVRQLALPSERNAASQCTTSWPRLSQHRWGPRAWVSEEEHGSPLGRQSSTEDGARGTTERRKRMSLRASWSP